MLSIQYQSPACDVPVARFQVFRSRATMPKRSKRISELGGKPVALRGGAHRDTASLQPSRRPGSSRSARHPGQRRTETARTAAGASRPPGCRTAPGASLSTTRDPIPRSPGPCSKWPMPTWSIRPITIADVLGTWRDGGVMISDVPFGNELAEEVQPGRVHRHTGRPACIRHDARSAASRRTVPTPRPRPPDLVERCPVPPRQCPSSHRRNGPVQPAGPGDVHPLADQRRSHVIPS